MKRDLEIIRDILLYVEDKDAGSGQGLNSLEVLSDFKRIDEELLVGHIQLIFDAYYLEGDLKMGTGGHYSMRINRLTNSGHDFLDSVRDPEIWDETKALTKKAGGWTLALVAEIAKTLVLKKLGL